MERVKVDFWEEEIRYNGDFENLSKTKAWRTALAKQERRGDATPYRTEVMPLEDAKVLDGEVSVENRYPCNKRAVVRWAFIREDDYEQMV